MKINFTIHYLDKSVLFLSILLFITFISCEKRKNATSVSQNPSPMTENIRPHERISSDSCAGKRIQWKLQNKTGWSAGYGAIRALISGYEKKINNIILLDGLHASYVPENQVLNEGGQIDANDLEPFYQFAKKAIHKEKRMVITHSSIFPGTYASTTECTDYLIEKLNLKRTAVLKQGPVGMQQVGATKLGYLSVLSYAGNTAPDHVDHLHGLSYFLDRILND